MKQKLYLTNKSPPTVVAEVLVRFDYSYYYPIRLFFFCRSEEMTYCI